MNVAISRKNCNITRFFIKVLRKLTKNLKADSVKYPVSIDETRLIGTFTVHNWRRKEKSHAKLHAKPSLSVRKIMLKSRVAKTTDQHETTEKCSVKVSAGYRCCPKPPLRTLIYAPLTRKFDAKKTDFMT